MQSHDVVLIPGDGIGPEVTEAVQAILAAASAPVAWLPHNAGLAALDEGKDLLPDDTVAAIQDCGVALKGPCTTPVGEGFSSVNVQLRKRLDLYSAVRPVRSLEGISTRFDGVDIVVLRENTEGLYSGIESEITDGVVTSLKVATETACTRIARSAFQYAVERGRRKVTVFHKANIMKLTDGLFIRCSRRVHEEEYPQVEYSELIIDAGCMRLVQDPSAFDVLLLENLYGDVRRYGRRPRGRAWREHRREPCGLRGRARFGSGHRGSGNRESAGAPDVRCHASELPRGRAERSRVSRVGGSHQARVQSRRGRRRDDEGSRGHAVHERLRGRGGRARRIGLRDSNRST